jgi:hypothetical protein
VAPYLDKVLLESKNKETLLAGKKKKKEEGMKA